MEDKEQLIKLYHSLTNTVNEIHDFLNTNKIKSSDRNKFLSIKKEIQIFLSFLDEVAQK